MVTRHLLAKGAKACADGVPVQRRELARIKWISGQDRIDQRTNLPELEFFDLTSIRKFVHIHSRRGRDGSWPVYSACPAGPRFSEAAG